MTAEQNSYLKNNWLTLANLLLLLTLSFRVGVVLTSLEDQDKATEQKIIDHLEDENVHMQFSRKIEIFVPRVELDSRLEAMTSQLDRIEEKIDNK